MTTDHRLWRLQFVGALAIGNLCVPTREIETGREGEMAAIKWRRKLTRIQYFMIAIKTHTRSWSMDTSRKDDLEYPLMGPKVYSVSRYDLLVAASGGGSPPTKLRSFLEIIIRFGGNQRRFSSFVCLALFLDVVVPHHQEDSSCWLDMAGEGVVPSYYYLPVWLYIWIG